ncbi:MAG: transaldolase [Thermomicrobiales bacterium]|nr:transaldolase [Thermomicrobiales bacterium]
MTNTVKQLVNEGQSIWQDDISRELIENGALKAAIEETGIRGVTSNPTIFQKAIAGSDTYDAEIKALLAEGKNAAEVFQTVAVKDIQDTCDLFRPLYDESNRVDGYVSLEVLPSLARDTKGTLENARILWKAVNRPNLMIKVPGTVEGVPAIRQLLVEGINVNVTLLFSLSNYEAVARTYIEALQVRSDLGEPVDHVASVASFFVSRVDAAADKQLDGIGSDEALALRGKAAIANAVLAYEKFEELFSGEQWDALAAKGAMVQRPLWASTGVKNPSYSDTLYVDTLIGPDTVNTAPLGTIAAFLDHGTVARTVDADYAGAHQVMADLAAVGVDIDAITAKLEEDGIASFMTSYDDLLASVDGKKA